MQNTKTRTFTEKTNGVGFSVKPVIALGAPEIGPKVTAGGGETVGTPCQPLVKVGRGARIDGFVLNKGSYQVWAIGNLSGWPRMIELRPMTEADLSLVEAWLREPHVARWWLADETAEETLGEYVDRVAGRGDTATTMLIVVEPGRGPVGWAQWYRWEAYPKEAQELRTRQSEVGLDYAIGDPGAIGRGLGAEMIAALVDEVRSHHPGCGVVVEPEAANLASRRVLERNGFALVDVRPLDFEPNDRPMAIYRLPGDG